MNPANQLIKKNTDVLALGEAMIEFNQTKANEPTYLQGFGGDTSNAVIAAARAGAKAAYLSRIGGDIWGEKLLQLWEQEGVDTSGVQVDLTQNTGVYFVTHSEKGHAFGYLRKGSAASQMSVDWLQSDLVKKQIEQAKILHVSGISLALSETACDTVFAAIHAAREAKTRVSFDSNLRLKLWSLSRAKACITQAISMCDLFLPSLEDMQMLLDLDDPDEIIDWSHAQGAREVVLKLGAKGALVSDAHQRQMVSARLVELVDATGAGDCFCGNLLARLALGDDLLSATQYANIAASLAVQGFGAVDPLPKYKDVQAILKKPLPAKLSKSKIKR